jgi:hypothetical protein
LFWLLKPKALEKDIHRYVSDTTLEFWQNNGNDDRNHQTISTFLLPHIKILSENCIFHPIHQHTPMPIKLLS